MQGEDPLINLNQEHNKKEVCTRWRVGADLWSVSEYLSHSQQPTHNHRRAPAVTNRLWCQQPISPQLAQMQVCPATVWEAPHFTHSSRYWWGIPLVVFMCLQMRAWSHQARWWRGWTVRCSQLRACTMWPLSIRTLGGTGVNIISALGNIVDVNDTCVSWSMLVRVQWSGGSWAPPCDR